MNWTFIIGVVIYLIVGAYTAVKCDQMLKAPNNLALAIAMFAWPLIAAIAGYHIFRTCMSGRL